MENKGGPGFKTMNVVYESSSINRIKMCGVEQL